MNYVRSECDLELRKLKLGVIFLSSLKGTSGSDGPSGPPGERVSISCRWLSLFIIIIYFFIRMFVHKVRGKFFSYCLTTESDKYTILISVALILRSNTLYNGSLHISISAFTDSPICNFFFLAIRSSFLHGWS